MAPIKRNFADSGYMKEYKENLDKYGFWMKVKDLNKNEYAHYDNQPENVKLRLKKYFPFKIIFNNSSYTVLYEHLIEYGKIEYWMRGDYLELILTISNVFDERIEVELHEMRGTFFECAVKHYMGDDVAVSINLNFDVLRAYLNGVIQARYIIQLAQEVTQE